MSADPMRSADHAARNNLDSGLERTRGESLTVVRLHKENNEPMDFRLYSNPPITPPFEGCSERVISASNFMYHWFGATMIKGIFVSLLD